MAYCKLCNPLRIPMCRIYEHIPPTQFAGTPLKCGSSCREAHGRCFQNRECGALLTSIPAKCGNIAVWNGRGDLPACNSDCRDALNRFSKLPNAIEVECCDCGEDVSCALFQAKIAAACPSLRNCKRVCMHACRRAGVHVCVWRKHAYIATQHFHNNSYPSIAGAWLYVLGSGIG